MMSKKDKRENLLKLVESINESEKNFEEIRKTLPKTIISIKELEDIEELRWSALQICVLFVEALSTIKDFNDNIKENAKKMLIEDK